MSNCFSKISSPLSIEQVEMFIEPFQEWESFLQRIEPPKEIDWKPSYSLLQGEIF